MIITSISARNYKSFKDLHIDFDKFTLIVGANASGKSNLISIFKFIKDIISEGLRNAVDMQGGINYVCNANAAKGSPVRIEITFEFKDERWLMYMEKNKLAINPQKVYYCFEITPNKKGENYNVSYDELDIQYGIINAVRNDSLKRREIKDSGKLFNIKILKKSMQSKYEIIWLDDEIQEYKQSFDRLLESIKYFVTSINIDRKELLISKLLFFMPPVMSKEQFINIYDFDPWHLKRPCQVNSKKILDENGGNLASVLQTLLNSKDKKQRFLSLIRGALPFVDKLMVDRNYDQSYSYKIKENYSNKTFYSGFLSDGTVSIIAIIIALYFNDDAEVVIIEEPERNIHPKLLAYVVQMAVDVSNQKQVIFTTHNSEILSNADINFLRFVQRNSEGYSIITKPADNDLVKEFLNQELTIGDIFTQNLLGE